MAWAIGIPSVCGATVRSASLTSIAGINHAAGLPIYMPDENTDPSTTSSGMAPNVAAGLSCIFPLIAGIIFLVIEKKNEFIRYWAAQSLIFGGAMFAASIALQVLFAILGAMHLGFLVVILGLVWLLVCLGAFVLWIVMLIKSFGGQKWDIPFISQYIPTVLGWFKTA